MSTTTPDPAPRATGPCAHGVQLRLVPTPGPPLERAPVVRMLDPGRRSPRPPQRPGPRPRVALPDDVSGPVLTRRQALPDPTETARRLVTMTLEAFSGRRPFAQLRGAYTLPVFSAISRGRSPAWCASGTGPLLVGAVRVSEPVDGVAEVSAVARRNGRAHAVAARLEGIDGRWRCTALQVG